MLPGVVHLYTMELLKCGPPKKKKPIQLARFSVLKRSNLIPRPSPPPGFDGVGEGLGMRLAEEYTLLSKHTVQLHTHDKRTGFPETGTAISRDCRVEGGQITL